MSSLDKALKIEPENGLAHYLLSVIFRLNIQFDKAAGELEIVTRYFPNFKNAYFELGETYFAMGKYKKAKTAFRQYAEKDKTNKDVQDYLKELRRMGY